MLYIQLRRHKEYRPKNLKYLIRICYCFYVYRYFFFCYFHLFILNLKTIVGLSKRSLLMPFIAFTLSFTCGPRRYTPFTSVDNPEKPNLRSRVFCFPQWYEWSPVSIKQGLRTADYGLRTGYKTRTRYKTRTADCGLGIK